MVPRICCPTVQQSYNLTVLPSFRLTVLPSYRPTVLPSSLPSDPHDTIGAIATAPGGAARGMVRLSGPDVVGCLQRCFAISDDVQLAEMARPQVVSGTLSIALQPGQCNELPCDLFLWPGRRSYTREPVAELHTIGSPPLLEAALRSVCQAGVRLAEPGEFTLRAFLAGRIDLTQAEAVLGIIDACDANQLNTAVAQMAGGLGRPLTHLRDELLQLMAEVEAGLDFVEEDIQFISKEELSTRLTQAKQIIRDLETQLEQREDAVNTSKVALFGAPNVGKSCLFNALVERFGPSRDIPNKVTPRAIVSPEEGTTRDYLAARLDLEGVPCEVIDTAGIETVSAGADKLVSAAAQSKTEQQQQQSIIRALCIEAPLLDSGFSPEALGDDVAYDLLVCTKVDLVEDAHRRLKPLFDQRPVIVTSTRTGQGVGDLAAAIRQLLVAPSAAVSSQVLATTATRCRESLRLAHQALGQAQMLAEDQLGDELIAAELRDALNEIGKVVGSVYTDDLLDRIFGSFCIGK